MSKAVPKTLEKYQKPASVFAEFEADSVQNRMILYAFGALAALPVA